MGKRKRSSRDFHDQTNGVQEAKRSSFLSEGGAEREQEGIQAETIQVITGSYDRILHGFTARISPDKSPNAPPSVSFVDTFLFNAHASAIHCLALSPIIPGDGGLSSKVMLASGSSDERINLYSISADAPVPQMAKSSLDPSLADTQKQENLKNKEIGNLLHHDSTVTALCFATRSKLLSAAEDNTIAVSRTRDWTVLSTIKAPMPKAFGRPSGDTAPLGGTPAGINDFSIHPSMKLMISVGKGERCMRLWNLVTGKKAGVLNFEKSLLQTMGETKHTSGEARKVLWSPDGDEFVVGFDRGAVVYGTDSMVKGVIVPSSRMKLHQMQYLSSKSAQGKSLNVLAVSTEDGRICFYSTASFQGTTRTVQEATTTAFLVCRPLAQLGGDSTGVQSRIKDFEILSLNSQPQQLIIVTACSDGAVKVWQIRSDALIPNEDCEISQEGPAQIGEVLETYETTNRITCLKAFVMVARKDIGDKGNVVGNPENGDEFGGFGSSDDDG